MDANYERTHQLNWSYGIKDISPLVQEVKLQAYWDKVDHLMDDRKRVSSNDKPYEYSMQTDATSQVYGAKLNGAFAAGPGTLTAGIDYYNRNWDAVNRMAMTDYRRTAMIPDVYIDNIGCFAGYEQPVLENLTIKGGLRGDLTWADAEKKTNKSKTSADFSTLGGNIQLIWTPAEHLETTLGIGSATRTPDPQELYINSAKQQGNPRLEPTRNTEADLGVKYATDRLYVKAMVFGSDLEDFIYLYQKETYRSFRNVSATIWGGEFNSQFAMPYNLYLKGSCSYTNGKNRTDGRPLSEIPPLKGTVSLRYDVNTWFIELAENFAARQYRVDKTLNEKPTDSWATTDLRAGLNYRALSVYGGVSNVLNKFYYTHLSYQRDPFASGYKVPENGRNFYMTITYKFL
jgi:iron complex outermembrane recepter protein